MGKDGTRQPSITGTSGMKKKTSRKTDTFGKAGKPIRKKAYWRRQDIMDVVVADGVTKIGDSAFAGCFHLESIAIPDSVAKIGQSAFWGCRSLTAVLLPGAGKGLDLGDFAFNGCSSLERVVFSGCMKEIKPCTFAGCSALKRMDFPEGLKVIGMNAFMQCTSLETVCLPDSVKSIDLYAFDGCTALKSIVGPEGVTSIGVGAFSGCSALESVVLPGSVKVVNRRAFAGCTALKSIVVPEGVASIGMDAFSGCSALEAVVLPGSLKEIAHSAFDGCVRLTKIEYVGEAVRFDGGAMLSGNGRKLLRWMGWLPAFSKVAKVPDSVTEVCASAFGDLEGLETIRLPDRVTDISINAFDGCVRLEKIEYSGTANRFEGGAMLSGDGTKLLRWMGWRPAFSKIAKVPDSVTEVRDSAFENLRELKKILLPAGVTKIANTAFDDCKNLSKVEYSGTAYRFEDGAMLSGDGTKLLRWIGRLPFDKIVKVPDSVTEVGDSAFEGLSELKMVILPDGVTAIGNRAFWGCYGLSSIHIPETVRSIGKDAFLGCDALTLVRYIMLQVYGSGGTCSRNIVKATGSRKSILRRLNEDATRIQSNPYAATDTVYGFGPYTLRVTTCDGRELYSRKDCISNETQGRNLKKNEYSVEYLGSEEGFWISKLIKIKETELQSLKKKYSTDDDIQALTMAIQNSLEVETTSIPGVVTVGTGVKLLGRSFKIEDTCSPFIFMEVEAFGPEGTLVLKI